LGDTDLELVARGPALCQPRDLELRSPLAADELLHLPGRKKPGELLGVPLGERLRARVADVDLGLIGEPQVV
jgi:hypothetical protein